MVTGGLSESQRVSMIRRDFRKLQDEISFLAERKSNYRDASDKTSPSHEMNPETKSQEIFLPDLFSEGL